MVLNNNKTLKSNMNNKYFMELSKHNYKNNCEGTPNQRYKNVKSVNKRGDIGFDSSCCKLSEKQFMKL